VFEDKSQELLLLVIVSLEYGVLAQLGSLLPADGS
jgi:hypothetical protein